MLNKMTALLLLFLFSLSAVAASTVMEIIPLQNRPASEIQPIIAPLLDASDTLTPNGFKLIVKTTPARLLEIKALIKQLDTVLNNLNITVIQSKDVNAEQLNAQASINVHFPINKPSDTQGQINARYEQKQRQHSRHDEQVLKTLEGVPAHIKTGSYHPIETTHRYNSRYGHRTITRQTQLIEASTGFTVLPRLNGEQVMLEISPWSDNLQSNGSIATQAAKTTIRTRLGEWVEIGAVNQQRQAEETGLLSHRQSNSNKSLRILIKVEKAN